MSDEKKVALVLLESMRPYNSGEQVGKAPDVARELVADGIAIYEKPAEADLQQMGSDELEVFAINHYGDVGSELVDRRLEPKALRAAVGHLVKHGKLEPVKKPKTDKQRARKKAAVKKATSKKKAAARKKVATARKRAAAKKKATKKS